MRSCLARRIITTSLATLGLVAAAKGAHAAPNVQRNVLASRVSNHALYLTPGSYTFKTANATPGTDTVIEVLDPSGANIAYNDDYAGLGYLSQVTINVTGAGTYRLLVHAYSAASAGHGDILQNGAAIATNEEFAGTPIAVDPGSFKYQTALAPNGTNDTVLYGVDCTTGRITAWDDDAGVGRESEFRASNICRLWLSAYSSDGNANVYVNDWATDYDKDGLGFALESALGTCDTSGPSACWGVANLADTDRDGLEDVYEVLGKDDAVFPQYLPAWGASPVHKDVFVEVDSVKGQATLPLTGGDANAAQGWYTPAPATDVLNPDGQPGVRLHMDIQVAADPSQPFPVYGNWGGSNQADTTDYVAAPNSAANFSPVRKGLFRYALFNGSQYGGQTAWSPGDRSGWGSTAADHGIYTFAHEMLGHATGLAHWGHDSWGAVNCKPQYKSVMNYAYGGYTPFSLGAYSDPIDAASAPERGPFPSYTGDLTDITGGNFGWTSVHLMPPFNEVDFNRDGVYSGTVRAGLAWASWVGCGTLMMNRQTPKSDPAVSVKPVSPKLIKYGNRLYAFWIDGDAKIHYSQGLVSGPDFNGSCPGGGDVTLTSTTACTTWSTPMTVPTVGTATGFSALAYGGGVIVAYREPTLSQLRIVSALGADASGNLGFGTDSAFASTTIEPELADMMVSPSVYGTSEIAAVIYGWSGNFQWMTIPGPGVFPMPQGNLLDQTGAPIAASTIGASAATFPNRNTGVDYSKTIGKTCAVLPTGNNLTLYCYDKAADRWADITSTFGCLNTSTICMPRNLGCSTTCVPKPIKGKVALQYHGFRDGNGAPVGNDPSQGQFWLAYADRVKDGDAPRVMMSSPLSATRVPDATMTWPNVGQAGDDWTYVVAGTGMSLFEDGTISALKGAWLQDYPDVRNGPVVRHLSFFPYFDGTGHATLKDGSDFRVMERGICLGLKPESFCGAAKTNPWGY